MKLLLDENISHRLLEVLQGPFPGSRHVQQVGLLGAADSLIWQYASSNGFAVVTKDVDFANLVLSVGAPPKVVWVKCGNQPRRYLATLFRESTELLKTQLADPDCHYVAIG